MLSTRHVVAIARLGLYRSQRGRVNHGRRIAPGGEELEFLTAGRGWFDADEGEVGVRRGHVLWHLPGEQTVQRFPSDDPYECLVVRFQVEGAPRRQVPRVTSWADPGEASQFATELLRAFHRGGYDPNAFAQYAYSRFLWQAHLSTVTPVAAALPEPLREALTIIEQRYLEPLGVDELAAMVGYSTAHLHDLFRRHLGQSPHQLIIEWRLRRARQLLATSEQTVREVARSSGFSDAVTFIRAFRRHVGETPLAYRKAHLPPTG
ncbi:MAG TPA: AraC family transcriptional regulator [Polyangiaceae bacterium]|jgi:AraC-like DNA-binding protein|nr:AraC family transcriptional regulator [Polyangiaceae bacterium]